MATGCRSMKTFKYEDHVGLWENELKDFMPECFFDVHEHIGPEDLVGPLDEERKLSALTTYTGAEWEELLGLYKDMYSGKQPKYVCGFGFVIHELDVRKANSYILNKAKEDSRLLPLLLYTPRDPEALTDGYEEAQKLGVKVYGVKPYYEFADKPGHFNALDVELEEFVTPDMLEFCNKHSMILMLHTCDIGMGSPSLRAKIQHILDTYTNIKLILAHLGRFYVKEQFFEFLNSDFLEKNKDKQFWFDVSSVTDEEALERAFAREDLYPRLLFGCDHPFGLIIGVEKQSETRGGIFLTRDEYPWSDPAMLEEFKEERKELTYNNYNTLKSLKNAIEKNFPDEEKKKEVVANLFYKNACKLFGVEE